MCVISNFTISHLFFNIEQSIESSAIASIFVLLSGVIFVLISLLSTIYHTYRKKNLDLKESSILRKKRIYMMLLLSFFFYMLFPYSTVYFIEKANYMKNIDNINHYLIKKSQVYSAKEVNEHQLVKEIDKHYQQLYANNFIYKKNFINHTIYFFDSPSRNDKILEKVKIKTAKKVIANLERKEVKIINE